MRRILCCLLVLTMAICALPVLSCAEGGSSNIEYFNDGSYTITEIHKERIRSSRSLVRSSKSCAALHKRSMVSTGPE